MDERLLNRVFNEAAASDQAQQTAKRRKQDNENIQKAGESVDGDSSAPMGASNAIRRILAAQKEKDWFR